MLELIKITDRFSNNYEKYGLYKCSCGNIKEIMISHVNSGHSKSCGCLVKKHGMRRSSEYYTWQGMKRRCYYKKNPSYKNYGGREIRVCDRWKNSFVNFLKDMGKKPSPELTIERKDTNKDYSPENCRWATMEEQENNKRNNILIEYKGKSQTFNRWSRELNIPINTLKNRIYRSHWSIEKAFTTQPRLGRNQWQD